MTDNISKQGAGPGRPKGASNKITRDIKEAVARAFEKVGGEDYLVTIAREDPKTFCSLLGRVIPLQIAGDNENPLTIQIVTGVPRAKD